jgi:hypothetical protein
MAAKESAQPAAEESGQPAAESPLDAAFEGGAFAERPELFVGAAFVGGFVLARILKRLRS